MALLWVPCIQCPELASRWSVLAISDLRSLTQSAHPKDSRLLTLWGRLRAAVLPDPAHTPTQFDYPRLDSSTRRDSSGPCSMRCDTATPFDELHACRYHIDFVPLGDCVSVNHGILALARDIVPSRLNHPPHNSKMSPDSSTHLEQLSSEYPDNSLSPASQSQSHRAHRIAASPLAPRPVSPLHKVQAHLTRDGPVVYRSRHRLQSCPSPRPPSQIDGS